MHPAGRLSFVGSFLLIGLIALGSSVMLLASAETIQEPQYAKWQPITLDFEGPMLSESGQPNPFRDYRLDVSFEQGGRQIIVPGYFAADGRAAETGAEAGKIWRVIFTPELSGDWSYTATLRKGENVAASASPTGEIVPIEKARGVVHVGPVPANATGFYAKGVLRYAGKRYLQFAETGEWFIKGGTDSPENFLGYYEFDQTPGKHRYQPHVRDWQPGDPSWHDGKGKGIIGALNYLAGKGMNSVYFLTMNVKGDGKDVWPWTSDAVRDRYDCSKLDQWEIVFTHMDKLGLMMHVITQETENDQLLNNGDLGTERAIYYRELIARFSHHLGLVWNLGEENTNTDQQRKDFARFIRAIDPCDHPIVVHTFPGGKNQVYPPLLGFDDLEGPSLQMSPMAGTHAETWKWISQSAQAQKPWFVCLDEIGPAGTGVKPDADDPNHDQVRRQALWGNLMAGGAGCEWYMGYRFPNNDLNCEDWRSRDTMWEQTRIALDFFHRYLPFTEMFYNDELVSDAAWCLAKPGEIYAVYTLGGNAPTLDLGTLNADFSVQWYDPRQGGELQTGSIAKISGPGMVSIGQPPAPANTDWMALVKLVGEPRGGAPKGRTSDKENTAGR